ncbi:MAG: FkbM family methyltransferase [Ilumatobacter sp.]|uniref:FkbM family methyltransferase n=1 Tax=Ilumatobacter sp. TaxID=1967498 RepID=UPI00391B3A8D
MTYRIALPGSPSGSTSTRPTLDLIDPYSTAVQRSLRRTGLAGYEPSTVAALLTEFERRDPGFSFADIGANIGLYSLLAATMFRPRSVTAFEPTPELADWARRLAAANRAEVGVLQVALSESAGTATLHLADASDVSNSLEAGFKASSSEVVVEVNTLDRVVEMSGNVPDVIKIDVEGHESKVLAGARATIETHRPTIVIEVLNRRGQRPAAEIAAAIDGIEYHCYPLDLDPDWRARPTVEPAPEHQDWLLRADPVDDDFIAAWNRWRSTVAICSAETNSRVPVARTAVAALRRGGVRELVGAVRRRSRRR